MKITRYIKTSSMVFAFFLIASAIISPSVAATTHQVSAKSKCVIIKSAVRKNYQLAQDIWRNQGFVVNPAKDALGLNRWPVIDSNWYVVSQYPKAGTCVKRGGSVTATVKKYSD